MFGFILKCLDGVIMIDGYKGVMSFNFQSRLAGCDGPSGSFADSVLLINNLCSAKMPDSGRDRSNGY